MGHVPYIAIVSLEGHTDPSRQASWAHGSNFIDLVHCLTHGLIIIDTHKLSEKPVFYKPF